MAQYDRFPLNGGLDTATPYLNRNPGLALALLNFAPDTDGGYRMSGGYERFDGQAAPSETIIYHLYLNTPMPNVLPGNVVSGASGAQGYVGRNYGTNLWVTTLTPDDFSVGETISFGPDNATITAITRETIDNRSYDPTAQRSNIMIVTPVAGRSLVPGMRMLGLTSGAEVTINKLLETADGYWLYTTFDLGQPQYGETMQATDASQYVYNSGYNVEPMLSDPITPAGNFFFLSEYRRSLIGPVPGVGPITGVWELEGTVYALRNDPTDTYGILHESTQFGWQQTYLGFTMTWDNRPSTVTDDFLGSGDTIRGATSGATATVGWVGYTAQDHSAGYLTYGTFSGAFSAGENIINDSQPGTPVIGKVASPGVANLIQPGGQHRFINHNFFGGTDSFAMYAANGTGPAWVYNKTNGFSFIPTGRDPAMEKPFEIKEYKEHLFLAFPFASIQHSVIASPMDWSGGLGALEFNVGANVSSLIPGPKSLIICTEKDIQSLEGGGVDDWSKEVITQHTGIARFTGEYQSQSFVLAQAGIIAVDRTDQFGNFADSVLSDRIRNIIVPLYNECRGSLARKDKGQYRVYFNSGTNICLSTNQGNITGFSQFDYGGLSIRSSCNPYGRVFLATDSGYVYHDDVGGSNDGEERTSVIRTSFANQGDPDTRKRFRRIDMTLNADSFVNFRVNFSFDKASAVPQSSIPTGMLVSGGGFWDLSNWNQVFWDASSAPTVSADIDGVGFDISTMVFVQSRIHPPFIVEDISLEWSPRRKVR